MPARLKHLAGVANWHIRCRCYLPQLSCTASLQQTIAECLGSLPTTTMVFCAAVWWVAYLAQTLCSVLLSS